MPPRNVDPKLNLRSTCASAHNSLIEKSMRGRNSNLDSAPHTAASPFPPAFLPSLRSFLLSFLFLFSPFFSLFCRCRSMFLLLLLVVVVCLKIIIITIIFWFSLFSFCLVASSLRPRRVSDYGFIQLARRGLRNASVRDCAIKRNSTLAFYGVSLALETNEANEVAGSFYEAEFAQPSAQTRYKSLKLLIAEIHSGKRV